MDLSNPTAELIVEIDDVLLTLRGPARVFNERILADLTFDIVDRLLSKRDDGPTLREQPLLYSGAALHTLHWYLHYRDTEGSTHRRRVFLSNAKKLLRVHQSQWKNIVGDQADNYIQSFKKNAVEYLNSVSAESKNEEDL